MASAADTDVSQLSFEDALKRLEEIVRTLEKGEAPLDRSIERRLALFERAHDLLEAL